MEWALFYIDRGLQALESSLMRTAGKYSFGNEITLADCCLVSQVYIRFKIDMTKIPTVSKVNDELIDDEK